MSDRRSDPGDWSKQSEALFQSARGDHAPSAADRARVRGALAQRLADASNVASANGELLAAGVHERASRVALGKLLKIGVGVACVMAGTFAFMRKHEASKPVDRTPAAAQPTAAGVKISMPTAAPSVSTQDAATTSHDQPVVAVVTHSDSTAPTARVVARHSRTRSTATKLSTSPHAPAQSEPKHMAAEVAAREPQASASNSAMASTSAVARETISEPVPARAASAQPSPVRLPAAKQEDSADERAELTFVAQINAAMLVSKLRTVLALCTEHERRWPHGAFVQEREGLRAIASCRLSVSGAAARARMFLASYPGAPLAPRVHDACVDQLAAAVKEHSAVGPSKDSR